MPELCVLLLEVEDRGAFIALKEVFQEWAGDLTVLGLARDSNTGSCIENVF